MYYIQKAASCCLSDTAWVNASDTQLDTEPKLRSRPRPCQLKPCCFPNSSHGSWKFVLAGAIPWKLLTLNLTVLEGEV